MTNVEVKNVSASNMRVNLTDIISDIPLNEVIAVTKRKDVVAYVISPETFEAVFGSSEDSEAETTEPVQTVGDLYEVNVNDDESPSDDDDDTEGGELIEFSQLDEDADLEEDDDFEHYLAQLKRQTMGFITPDSI
jgi:PHD/YefM family antitoxin component YafN of YafNO toxin-antitoxin module